MSVSKKICSVFTAFLMLVSVVFSVPATSVFAAGTPTLSAENKTVDAGSEFTVNVNIKNATSVYNGNFTLQYDSSKLEVESYKYGSIFNEHTRNCNLNYQSTGNQIRFTFSGAYALTGDGTLVTFTFRAKENVSGTSSLNFTAYKIYDENGISLSPTAANGSVSISEKVSAKPELSVVGGTVNEGDTISVPVKIKNTESVYNGNFTLQYDSSLLTVESYTYGSIFNEHTKNCNLNYQSTGNQIRFTFSGAYALTGDGILVTFTFRAKENISGTSDLKFTAYKIYNENGISLSTTATNGSITVHENSSSNIETGQCGDNAYYELDRDTGVLRITGTGVMWDWNYMDSKLPPWFYHRTLFNELIIEKGIQNIGSYAFHDCSNLSSVSMANSVIDVGQAAFMYCDSLANITLSNNIESIDSIAFAGCGALKNIVLPEKIKTIGYDAFGNCIALTNIMFPDEITDIGNGAFSGCESLERVSIPDNITCIGSTTFEDCTSLKYIEFSENLNYIDSYAFENCSSLTNIIIPNSVTGIGADAFKNCDSLEHVTILGNTTYMGENVFENCSNLTIYGYRNSTAQTYANNNDIPFIALDAVELSSISMATQPSKKVYYIGDSLDTSALQLKITYSDGSTEMVSSGYTTSGFSSTTAGTKTVTVTYEGLTTTFNVTVNAPSISLSQTSKTMMVGDTATLTATTTPSGQSVTWTSSNSSVASVSNGVVTAKASGTATITAKFTYNGKTYSKTCNITVNNVAKTLTSISISSNPIKTTYEIGESLNTSGLKLKLNYSDGSSEIVSSGFTTNGFDSSTAGAKTVTVTYQDKTTAFNITVNKAASQISAKYKISSVTATAGSTIDVYVSIENNPGIISLRNKIIYDTSVMELVNVEDLKLLSGYTTPSPTIDSPYTLRWADSLATQNNTASGNIVKLTFKIKDDTMEGEYSISVSHIEARTVNGEKVEFSQSDSVINVINYLPGDVDNDGEVNDWDAIVLNRYLAGWNTEINKFAADVDKDGEITDWDAIVLERYLADWDIELN